MTRSSPWAAGLSLSLPSGWASSCTHCHLLPSHSKKHSHFSFEIRSSLGCLTWKKLLHHHTPLLLPMMTVNILNQGLPLTVCVQYLPQHGNLSWNLSQLLPPMWRSSSVHVPGGLRPSSASLNLFSKGSFLPNPQSPTAACFTVEELKTSPTVTNTDKTVIVLRCQRFKHAANPQFYHYLVINLDYKTKQNNFSTTISSLNIQFHIWVSHLQYFQSHFWMRPSSYISLVFLRNTLTHCLISLQFSCLQFEMFVCSLNTSKSFKIF